MHFHDLFEALAMRELMRIVETGESRRQAGTTIGRQRKFTLKTGEIAVVTLTMKPKHGTQVIVADATIAGVLAGDATFAENISVPDWDTLDQGSWSCLSVHVYPEFRRRGVASALYDTMARAGFKILRSGHYGGKLLPDGDALWQSRMEWRKRKGESFGRPYHPRFWKPRKPTPG